MNKKNVLILAICFAACAKQELSHNPTDDGSIVANVEEGDIGNDIMCTNNSSNKLEVFNYGDENWNDAGSMRWSWMPTTGLGYTSSEVSLWTNGDPEGDPMDAKRILTDVWSGTSEVLVAAGGQLA